MESISEMIKSRTYLLDFQKNQLIEDLALVTPDNDRIGKIMDAVLYRLLGKGWDSLTGREIQDIYDAWKGGD